jgi:DNA-binding LacI/PurR family transcriptional regulator
VEKSAAALGRDFSSLPRTYGQRIDRFLRHQLMWEFLHTEVACAMEPLCERALKDGAITAWVAANDETATILMDFLQMRGVKVPRQISVISFDNFHDAARRRLTSYDFNLRAVLHAALTFLVHTAEFTDLRRKSVIEMPGMLVERESVRKATGTGSPDSSR